MISRQEDASLYPLLYIFFFFFLSVFSSSSFPFFSSYSSADAFSLLWLVSSVSSCSNFLFFLSCAVAKIFKPDCLEYYQKELRFLQATAKVSELEGRVSKLLPFSPPEGYFLLSPVGVHFACSEVAYSNTRYCSAPQPDTASPKGPQFVRAKPSTFADLGFYSGSSAP